MSFRSFFDSVHETDKSLSAPLRYYNRSSSDDDIHWISTDDPEIPSNVKGNMSAGYNKNRVRPSLITSPQQAVRTCDAYSSYTFTENTNKPVQIQPQVKPNSHGRHYDQEMEELRRPSRIVATETHHHIQMKHMTPSPPNSQPTPTSSKTVQNRSKSATGRSSSSLSSLQASQPKEQTNCIILAPPPSPERPSTKPTASKVIRTKTLLKSGHTETTNSSTMMSDASDQRKSISRGRSRQIRDITNERNDVPVITPTRLFRNRSSSVKSLRSLASSGNGQDDEDDTKSTRSWYSRRSASRSKSRGRSTIANQSTDSATPSRTKQFFQRITSLGKLKRSKSKLKVLDKIVVTQASPIEVMDETVFEKVEEPKSAGFCGFLYLTSCGEFFIGDCDNDSNYKNNSSGAKATASTYNSTTSTSSMKHYY